MAFREFQITSAQILVELGQPSYAFAAYAWPAFQSLNRKSVPVRKDSARRLCIHLLDKYRGDEQSRDQAENLFRGYIDVLSQSSVHPFFSFDLLPPVTDIENCFHRLQTEVGRAEFRNMLR